MVKIPFRVSLSRFGGVWSWSTIERGLSFAAVVIGSACLIASLSAHIRMMAYPGPQEVNEPATWHETWLLANGRNPFVSWELPGGVQLFGPLYSYVVIALKPVLGGTGYFAHRFLNLLCIGASFWLIGAHLRRLGANLGIVFSALSVLYWIVLGNLMITARPDALGWWLYLLALLVPAARDYKTGASIFGLICAMLAFHCKAYFAIAGCATLLGVALRQSFWTAYWTGLAYFFVLALSVGITTWFFPLYFFETIIVQHEIVLGNSTDAASRINTLLFLKRAWPFLVIIMAGLGLWLRGPARERWQRWRSGLATWRETLRPASATEVLALVFVGYLALVYFYMGRNGGASFTYHLHLLFPLLLVLTAAAVRERWLRLAATVLLAVFALTSLQVRWSPTDSTAYQRIRDLIGKEPGEVFALAAAVEPLDSTHKYVYDDGFTTLLGFAFAGGRPDRMQSVHLLLHQWQERDAELKDKVAQRTFGLILTEEDKSPLCKSDLIKANYTVVEKLDLPAYFNPHPVRVWVWRPKPR